MTFQKFKRIFKKKLVSRYNWTVGKACRYNHPELKSTFEEGLTVEQALRKLIEKSNDYLSSQLIEPVST